MRINIPEVKNLPSIDCVQIDSTPWFTFRHEVETLNKMLAEGTPMWTYSLEENCYWTTAEQSRDLIKKYTGLLINVQPIKKRTAEAILHSLCKRNWGTIEADPDFKGLKNEALSIIVGDEGER